MELSRRANEASPPRATAPLTTATRQRLQKVFEHGQRCVDKKDHDYANQLFSQCVTEDPGNLIYLQSFFANLQKKFADGKKVSKLAGLKIKSHRSSLEKAAKKGNWEPALKSGCAALTLNPWDPSTLLAMAGACEELQFNECRLFFLRWGLDADAKHVELNRQAALTLEQMGQFDQAIACWQRVQQARPEDEESRRSVSRLSVEKTIHEGGYDPALLSYDQEGPKVEIPSVSSLSRGSDDKIAEEAANEDLSPEQRVIASIRSDPTNLENYLQLSDICVRENRYIDAEDVLGRGLSIAGSADFRFVERLEDVQLRRAQNQIAVAEQRHEQGPTEDSEILVIQLRNQANQVELEIYSARSAREPSNPRLQFELGLRLKRVGKTKDAIPAFQAAKSDPKRTGLVLLELGECFQKIEQFKLALSHYEQTLEACAEPESDTRRLALYRAGVLATGLKELDRAERHLSELASLDYSYRDVAERLDKIARLRDSG